MGSLVNARLEHLFLCCLTVLPYCLFTVIAVAFTYSGQINDDDDDDDDDDDVNSQHH